MSYDLISRKVLVERVKYLFTQTNEGTTEHYAYGVVLNEIRELPMAFDKEKVHSELIELRNAEVSKPDFATKYEENWSHGRYSAFLDAIRIVEKGGIE